MEETEQPETVAESSFIEDRSTRKLLFKKRSTSSTCAVWLITFFTWLSCEKDKEQIAANFKNIQEKVVMDM